MRGHLVDASSDVAALIVSSHAPVRGHLSIILFLSRKIEVSSHAPVRGHLLPVTPMPSPL